MDAAGNIFVTGYFEDDVVFGTTTLSAGPALTMRGALFVGKLNTAGTWQWATKFGVDNRLARTTTVGVALAPNGDVLLGGTFNDLTYRTTFPFSFGSIILMVNGNQADVFAARLDPTGTTWRWAVRAGGTQPDGATAIATDAAGNAYLTGFFEGPVTFGGQSLASAGGNDDVFVAKLDPTGQWAWASGGGGNSIATDAAGNCAIAGRIAGSYGGTVTFGATTLVLNPGVASSAPDVLVAKLSSSGQWQWAARAGGRGEDAGTGVALDAQGRVFAVGTVSIGADFGSTTLNNTPVGNPTVSGDKFLGLLSSAGTWQWVTQIALTRSSPTYNPALAFDGRNVFVTNAYLGQADFGIATFSPAPAATNAGYLAKLGATPLATRGAAAALQFAVAPNPVASGAALTLHTATAGTFELRDALGRPMLATQAVSAGQGRVALPASLAPGLYLATLRTADGIATQRLMLE